MHLAIHAADQAGKLVHKLHQPTVLPAPAPTARSLHVCAPLPSHFHKSEHASVSLGVEIFMSLSLVKQNWEKYGSSKSNYSVIFKTCKILNFWGDFCHYCCNQLPKPWVIWAQGLWPPRHTPPLCTSSPYSPSTLPGQASLPLPPFQR